MNLITFCFLSSGLRQLSDWRKWANVAVFNNICLKFTKCNTYSAQMKERFSFDLEMIYFLRHAEHKQNDKQTEIKGTAGKRARLSVGL